MSTEIEVAESKSLALDPDQYEFTPAQVKALEHIGVDKAEPGDLQVFHHVCQRTGLDPFARQIYMIGRKGRAQDQSGQWVDVVKQTIQTGIDGFRLIGRRAANAAGHSVSVAAPEWAHEDGTWRPVWSRSWGVPVAARVTIRRAGEPFTAIALFDEYAQVNRNGELSGTWGQRPAGQLAKCAEALAWRMSFPQDLSGLYTDDEMGQADNTVQGEVVERPESPLGAALADQTSDPDPGVLAPDEPHAAVAADEGEPSGSEPVDADDVEDDNKVTAAQLRKIGALMGKKDGLGITDRAEALGYVAAQVGRPVESRSDLSKSEANTLIDALEADVRIAKESGA